MLDAHMPMTRLGLLVDLTNSIHRRINLDGLMSQAAERIAEALGSERATIWLMDAEQGVLVSRIATLPEAACLHQPMDRGIVGHVARTGERVRVNDVLTDPRFDPSSDRATGYVTRSILALPIVDHAGGPIRGVLQVLNRRDHGFNDEDEVYAQALACQFGELIKLTHIASATEARPGLRLPGPFNGIVGRSPPMEALYERLLAAAETDVTVLLRGETGTGKTLVAKAISDNSPRAAGPFVTVDCMTLPATLVESELFGYEAGAFTGAVRRMPGRVELAHGGTLFLDEVGDLPLDAQGKLLRLLQDRTFERVGGRGPQLVDARIIAATHQDLESLVKQKRFREDLYYRLRVVELSVPALRERGRDELLALTRHFAELYAKRYRRPPTHFDASALLALRSHDWPGNVRELEHWIEGAVVLAKDGIVRPSHFPRVELKDTLLEPASRPFAQPHPGPASSLSGTLEEGPDSSSSATPNQRPRSTQASGSDRQSIANLDEIIRQHVSETLLRTGQSRAKAARLLGISRNRLARILGEGEEGE